MLDAEGDADMGQITQAIQFALRSNIPSPISTQKPSNLTAIPNVFGAESEDAVFEEIGESALDPILGESKSRANRKVVSPKVLEIDLNTPPSFIDFATDKNPSSLRLKFLVVAAWFKTQRQTDAITADHIYTCFRIIKWSTAMADFSKPLRDLKSQQFVERTGKGLYAINHLGLSQVDRLGRQE